MMTKKGISRILNAAFRAEMSAYSSLIRAARFSNPLGRGAIRSSNLAGRKLSKAKQLRLALEMRCESEAREKKAKALSIASKDFRDSWDGGKRKHGAKRKPGLAGTDNRGLPDFQKEAGSSN